ncbi:MAG: YggS family pyridoxal phosphate-dependent enzyme [Chloroflexota bacterium]
MSEGLDAHPDPAEVARLQRARALVMAEIRAACERVGRDPAGVQLIAVSKTVPAERLRAAVAAGLRDLGENRVQEATAKADLVRGARWHLIGPLQSNKTRRAVETFDAIQTVDSTALAVRLDGVARELRPDRPLPVMLQVNVDGDPAKSGFTTRALVASLPEVVALAGLDVRGLMTVGRFVQEPAEARATFVALRRLSEQVRSTDSRLGPELSMGMSADFQIAVEEGATVVRVGQAIFGTRSARAD